MMNEQVGRLSRKNSVLVVVDIQEKLLPAINERDVVLDNVVRMVRAAQTLQVPILVTEQYPRGLGATVATLQELLAGTPTWEKTTFSCFGGNGFSEQVSGLARNQLVLVGIETHICVCQTALDGLARGYQVQLINEAVGSRTAANKALGIERIRAAGGVISGVEMAIYEWLEEAGGPEFKAILPLIK